MIFIRFFSLVLLLTAGLFISVNAAFATTVTFGPSVTASQLNSAIADNNNDVIELTAGTYCPGSMTITANRTRPVIIRPAAGATVIWGGGTSSAFEFKGGASYITLEGIIFDGYKIGDTGIIWAGNAHDLTFNKLTWRNSSGATPYKSWAIYLSKDAGVGVSNITISNATVIGNNRTMSAFTAGYREFSSDITFRNVDISHVAYAGYFTDNINNMTVDNWRVVDSGYQTFGNFAVYFSNDNDQLTGVYKDICLSNSGTIGNYAAVVNGGNTQTDPPGGCPNPN